ncbi:hypothetical protein [Flagellimonas sp. CMM7]|uniref:hypothetical protein n=1 Tax=Flagellimonas sp. CMM7 TaxID=2654676 RepID=UPI0013CFB2D9|nr:hypothetical protein [Flagellimonas sp. CMM7]UII78586.1 hypothetical protein LV704_13030 [Flagellimonas sp. CMM7]
MKKVKTLIIISFALVSCKNEKDEILTCYRKERTSFSEISMNKASIDSFKISDDLLQSFDKLTINEKRSLLNEEVLLFDEFALYGLGPSGMAVIRDSLNGVRYKCGSIDYSEDTIPKMFSRNEFFYDYVFPQTYYIPIRWYVINKHKDSTRIFQEDLNRQIDILNNAFKTTKIQFFTYSSTWETNSTWYRAYRDSDEYFEMIEALAEDPKTAINIFVTKQDSLLGAASFPWDKKTYQTIYDEILLKETTFEGHVDKKNGVMLGKTLIHEMGHFFGLFHTFHMEKHDANNKPLDIACDNDSIHNGCGELTTVPRIGDGIEDTPPQKICHYYGCGKCEFGKSIKDCDTCGDENSPDIKWCDTCPNLAGLDPIKNYMGYNPDYCMDQFTLGQYKVIKRNFMIYRRYLNSVPINNTPVAALKF